MRAIQFFGNMIKKVTDRKSYFCELVDAARDYCLLIEHVDIYKNGQWLRDMARILPRLQTAITHLDDRDIEFSFFSLPDLEERFELYCKLKDQLGNCDPYMLEYDQSESEQDMSGSLAGDCADIYFELKRGLNLYNSEEENQQAALTIWQTGYILIWGKQLVNAQKHLFSLRIADKI